VWQTGKLLMNIMEEVMIARKTGYTPAILMGLLLFVFILFNLTPAPLGAQSSYGAIVGTVADSSGAVIPGAKVTLTDIGTSETKKIESDAAGNFRFLNLPPTTYKVEVNKASYKKVIEEHVTVLVSMTTRVDVVLEVGAVSETVVVTTAAPLIQTDSGTLGTQVEGKTVQEMPLNGRNVTNLIAMTPGVTASDRAMGSTSMNNSGRTNSGNWNGYTINGSSNTAMEIDGASINLLSTPASMGGASPSIAYVPTQDSVQEFKLSTSAVDPSIGHYGGGVVEMSSKSGSNKVHGSTYEYLRNTVLNANEWFNKQSQVESGEPNKPGKWLQNQYGASVGGPIKKDKIFFHANWEGFDSRTSTTYSGNVPTFAMRGGQDYNQDPILPGVTSDPTKDSAVHAACPTLSYNSTNNTVDVPAACIDPVASVYRKFWADPNAGANAPTPGQYVTNYVTSAGLGNDNYQLSGRIDYALSNNQKIFGRYSYNHMLDMAEDDMGSPHKTGFSTAGGAERLRSHQVVLGDTYTVNPKTIADLRLSYVNYNEMMDPTNGVAPNYANMGYGSTFTGESKEFSNKILPVIGVGFGGQNVYNLGLPPTFKAGNMYRSWYDTYQLSGNIIRMIGSHTLKLGAEGRLMDFISLPQSGNAGSYSASMNDFAKNEFLNFLLGIADSSSLGIANETAAYNWYQAYFVNDSWNVTRQLTVTAGVRWELPGGMYERKDRGTVLLPKATVNLLNQQTNQSVPTLGTLALVNSPLAKGRSMSDLKYDLFSPRIGFAYRLEKSTVLRGGFSINYNSPDSGGGVAPNSQVINSATSSITNTDNGSPLLSTLSNPFPANNLNLPVGRTGSPNGYEFMNGTASTSGYAYVGANSCSPFPPPGGCSWQWSQASISGAALDGKVGYAEQFNLGVAHEFRGNTSLEISWTGKQDVKQTIADNLDQVTPAYYGAIGQLMSAPFANAQSVASTIRNNTALYPNSTPYGQAYANFTNSNAHWGQDNYNAMQVTFQKRFSSLGQINSYYTWAKQIGLAGLQDATNHHQAGDRSVMTMSIKDHLVTNYVLNLPFGKGQMFAGNVNGIVDHIIGGWALNGITTLQSGSPLAITNGGSYAITALGATSVRANYTSGCTRTVSGSTQTRVINKDWFNAACFTAPNEATATASYYPWGSEPAVDRVLTAPGIANWDFTLVKTTPVTESMKLTFRMEFFNIFNRTQFDSPNTTIGGGGFGPPGMAQSSPGQITDTLGHPRQMQGSLRLDF
jgi:hypothetical protein